VTIAVAAAVAAAMALAGADPVPPQDAPQYTAAGLMLRPQDYREWVFLSSGLGMTYGPLQSNHPRFDNVFVSRPAYRAFLETGRWPDRTVLILEVREAQSKGSINQAGHFQTDLVAMEAHVKDEKRFRGGWAFFGFARGAATAKATPETADCYSCHAEHGAVDTTFVQFYPTLLEAAQAKGTLKPETVK